MLMSMTGFGRASISLGDCTYEVEVKSVNSRFFDVTIKLPQSLLNREYELREIIKSNFSRGKLSVFISQKKNGFQPNEKLLLDYEKLNNTINIIRQIKKTAKLRDKIKLEHILYNKDIFSLQTEEISDDDFEKLKSAFSNALNQLTEMKKREGAELEKDLTSRIKNIESKVQEIESESSKSVNEHFENYKNKVLHLLNEKSGDVYDDRLRLELAILTERSDISEECVRLKSHVKFFIDVMKNENEPGRKLNFLCQEINREANTISAKSMSKTITHKAIEIKEEIERIREQIQNVE
jgi:uncharacterized protein (TIGR00255 family)